MADDNAIAYTESYDKDGNYVRVDTVAGEEGKIEEKNYISGGLDGDSHNWVSADDKDAVAELKAKDEAAQADADAANEAAEAEAANEDPAATAARKNAQGGAYMSDTSNNFDVPEPVEKTEQQLHDEEVTAGNAAGPANAGVSTGEWVDAQQEKGELASDEDANAARSDADGATGDAGDADAKLANPKTRAKKTP